MALSPNVVVVAPGDLITAQHLNNVRSNLDRLDTTTLKLAGGTMTGHIVTSSSAPAGSGLRTDAPTGVIAASDSGGRLFVGKSAPDLAAVGIEGFGVGQLNVTNTASGSSNFTAQHNGVASANGERFATFRSPAAIIGSITQVSTTGVAYNATSDYRLKDDLGPVVDPLGRVLALRPIRFAWKADGFEQDGFFAHEVADVAAYAVTGEKDAVFAADDPNDAGQIIPQQLDAAKLVPLLVAAVQALAARVEQLEAPG